MPFLTKQQILEKYDLVLGFEIHVELNTPTKMFCACPADWFGKDPNTQTCPVCLGMPGALPVINQTALENTIKLAKALNCKINLSQQFDRKHYFYPDLPKGYQITQFYKPVGQHGYLEFVINGKPKRFRIRRVHLEEDTGKLTHKFGKSLVDFNRSGVPLVEIVTEPDFTTPQEAKLFLKSLQVLVRTLKISDADMEKGSMRLEPNISLKPKGSQKLPSYKVEVKNINSFNFAVKAIEYEILRQGKLLEQGQTPAQETRGFDASTGKTVSQRRKEVAQDYRYLPEPDLPPIEFTQQQIQELTKDLPETPNKLYNKLINMQLDPKIAWLFVENFELGSLFNKLLASNAHKEVNTTAQKLAKFIANKYTKYRFNTPQDVIAAFKKEYSTQSLDPETIQKTVKQVLEENPKVVQDYKNGKTQALQFLIGRFMQKIRKKVDIKPVIEELKRQLDAIK